MEATRKSSVLRALAARYERARAGRTGKAARDFAVDFERLLREAGCDRGESRICAERDLDAADAVGLLTIERHRRTNLPLSVRFSSAHEERLFEELAMVSPSKRRNAFAAVFLEAAELPVPERWGAAWQVFCRESADAAAAGQPVASFSRDSMEEAAEILNLLPQLLAWQTESLRRFASCRLCGDSKRLESLQGRILASLVKITSGAVKSLEDLGIMENERAVILHGPLRLRFSEGTLDLGLLSAPARIDRRDLNRSALETSASRCLTVENLTVLHELAKRNAGILLASSGSEGGFAHSALIEFLQALPGHVSLSHCGDSDPKGFEILSNLRERVGRAIESVAMTFDSSKPGPLIDDRQRKTISRLLGSPHLTETEKSDLNEMLSAGHMGNFEQESRPLPE